MAKEEYGTSTMYQGGYSTLDPDKGEYFTGYHSGGGSLGLTTDPRTANIIKDTSGKLASGAKHMELALISPELWDSIPKQQLEEVRQLSKLTGSTVSIHGPVSGTDPSGFSQQGWSEINRKANERKITQSLNRSHDADPTGNIIVTFHSAEGIPGTDWERIPDKQKNDPGEAQRLIAIDREKGQPTGLEKDQKYYPGRRDGEKDFIKEVKHTAEAHLEIANSSQWDSSIDQLTFNQERADQILRENEIQIAHLMGDIQEKKLNKEHLTPVQQDAYLKVETINNYLKDISTTANSLFSKSYKYALEDQDQEKMKYLGEVSKLYKMDLEKSRSLKDQSSAIQQLLLNLRDEKAVANQIVPIEQFVTKQSSKTFGNAAFDAYTKFGDAAPIVSIENPPIGLGPSTGEDIRNIVKASRDQFVRRAVEDKGIRESEAKKLAEKFIGATWDVGHINVIRGKGASEKDIISETEKVAPYLKHVHLSDNFGFEHTELPMGMGNVPLKKIMEKLGQKGFEAKKVIEAGQWWQHFQTNPLKETMQGLGSPMYSESAGPYWNQSLGFEQGYMGGLEGAWLPNNNYETFGTTFSRLPQELGGSAQQGTGGRMGGGRV